LPGTILGTVIFPRGQAAVSGRLGFAGSNRPGHPIQYINATIDGFTFKALLMTTVCLDQCRTQGD
jgi:hypothetical protein